MTKFVSLYVHILIHILQMSDLTIITANLYYTVNVVVIN